MITYKEMETGPIRFSLYKSQNNTQLPLVNDTVNLRNSFTVLCIIHSYSNGSTLPRRVIVNQYTGVVSNPLLMKPSCPRGTVSSRSLLYQDVWRSLNGPPMAPIVPAPYWDTFSFFENLWSMLSVPQCHPFCLLVLDRCHNCFVPPVKFGWQPHCLHSKEERSFVRHCSQVERSVEDKYSSEAYVDKKVHANNAPIQPSMI